MRYEFLEALVRLAIAKYGRGQATEDVAEAVKMILEKNIAANLPAYATLKTNDFRKERLYNEEVDLVLKKHNVMLKALYSRYRMKPAGGGLRTKSLKIEGWGQLMADAKLVDSQFTLVDSNMAFLWSRMLTIDEIKDYGKYTSLTFVDFLEALGRMADMKSLPSESELNEAGYENILDWSLEKERMDSVGEQQAHAEGEAGQSLDIFRIRDSAGVLKPKPRPLRLYYDPSNPDGSVFNHDQLLKLVKKIDKDMGP
eukprot:gene23776-9335_t